MALPEDYEHEPEPPKPEPPDELKLLWQIERYKALPLAGGLLDQPVILMQQINICANVRDEVTAASSLAKNIEASNAKQGDPFGII